MTFTKSESDKLIKPQGVIQKITTPETCDPKEDETSSVAEFASPTDVINPGKDSGSDDMINDMNDLVIEEDSPSEFQLKKTEVLEDVGAIESNDDVAFD